MSIAKYFPSTNIFFKYFDKNPYVAYQGEEVKIPLNSVDIGLGNVTNESKETMFTDSVLTGTATAITPSVGTNNNQIATTEFVKSQGYLTHYDSLSIDGGTF